LPPRHQQELDACEKFHKLLDRHFRNDNFFQVKVFSFAFLIGVLAATSITRAADITGTITLIGTPPAEVPIADIMSDVNCGPMYKEMPTTHHYVVGPNGEFGNVVVSLQNADGSAITGKSTGAGAPPVVLNQKGCVYVPQILAAQTGQKIVVKNSDPCVHNVDITDATGTILHNDVQMPNGADLTYTFDKPQMFMTFSPYYSISGTDGKFVIKDVPPGKYTIVADHRKLGQQTQNVEVGNKDVTVNFTFHVK
jgi:plastocyanin